MPESLFLAAARAIAGLADASDPAKGLLPDIERLREVSATVAVDVVKAAVDAGSPRVEVDDPDRRGPVRRCGSPNTPRSRAEEAPMSQTVAEILVDQMVEAGIRNVYGIVGDSANPIVDAMRRHTADIDFVHVRNEEAGAFAAGADAQVSGRPDRRPRLLRAGQRPPAQRALRLPAKRLARVRDRNAHPAAPRSAPAISRRPIRWGCSRAAATTSR